MTAGYDVPKIDPRGVARASLDGLVAGAIEVLADEPSAFVKASLASDPTAFYAMVLAG